MWSRWKFRLVLALGALTSSGFAAERVRAAVAETHASEPAAAWSPRVFARALLAETNRVRKAHGQPPLRRRFELEQAADDQAAFMALRRHVQHESILRGQATPFERVHRHGYWVEVGAVAENVAATSLGEHLREFTAERIAALLMRQWLESPGHRATLLDPSLTHFGGSVRLAQTVGGGWAAYGAQVFVITRGGAVSRR
jgi:uncharacterized protein YkwD